MKDDTEAVRSLRQNSWHPTLTWLFYFALWFWQDFDSASTVAHCFGFHSSTSWGLLEFQDGDDDFGFGSSEFGFWSPFFCLRSQAKTSLTSSIMALLSIRLRLGYRARQLSKYSPLLWWLMIPDSVFIRVSFFLVRRPSLSRFRGFFGVILFGVMRYNYLLLKFLWFIGDFRCQW